MRVPRAVVIATGIANTASVVAAFRRCGVEAELTVSPERVAKSPLVVLPGVGSFGAGMEMLRDNRLEAPLLERWQAGRPLLAICLGMQLLCRASEESPGIAGLGFVDSEIKRFGPSVKTPQFGWNRVDAAESCRMLESGSAYFANSFRLVDCPLGWSPAISVHDGPFVAAMERGPMLACQFHPELSGQWGTDLLRRWVCSQSEGVPC